MFFDDWPFCGCCCDDDAPPTPLQQFVADGGTLWLDPSTAVPVAGLVQDVPELVSGIPWSTLLANRMTVAPGGINGVQSLKGASTKFYGSTYSSASPHTYYSVIEMPGVLVVENEIVFRGLVNRCDLYSSTVSGNVFVFGGATLTVLSALAAKQRALVRVVSLGTVLSVITVLRHAGTVLTAVGSLGAGNLAVSQLGSSSAVVGGKSFSGSIGEFLDIPGDYSSSDAYLIDYLLNKYGIVPL